MMKQKYTFLRVIAGLFLVAGFVVAILGVLLSVLVAVSPTYTFDADFALVKGPAEPARAIPWFAGALISGVVLIAFGQLFNVFLDIEANTRLTAHHLTELLEARRTR